MLHVVFVLAQAIMRSFRPAVFFQLFVQAHRFPLGHARATFQTALLSIRLAVVVPSCDYIFQLAY